MGRLTAFLGLVAVICAFAVAGCGGGSSSSPLGAALGYLPKDAPFAVAIDTNLKGGQYKALGKIVDKFPFGNQVKQGVKEGLQQRGSLDFDRDIKPVLGNPFVVGAPDARSFVGSQSSNSFVAAIKAKDEGKLQDLVKKSKSDQVGDRDGAKIYRDRDGDIFAVKDGVLVVAGTRKLLDDALDRHGSDDRLKEGTFDGALKGLPQSALVRVYGDLQALVRDDPGAARARKVKWVAALRRLGATASVKGDRIAVHFDLRTDPSGLEQSDLPIASGSGAPAVVKRAGEIGLGLRDPRQIVEFAQQAAQAASPAQFGQFEQAKRQLRRALGVDLDRDVFDQLTGELALTSDVKGRFGARAELRDPGALRRTLRKLAPVLPSFARGAGLGASRVEKPKGRNGLYRLVGPNGQTAVFGVVGDVLVVSSDAARAARLAATPPTKVPGAEGAVVVDADAQKLADSLIRRLAPQLGLGGALGAQLFTAPLGELSGSAKAATDGIRGSLTLSFD